VATGNYSQAEWDAAKEEIKNLLIERAKVRGMIPYSELADKVRSMNLEAHDQRLFHLLGEISSEESREGRGMLSVIVVHKVGDMQPGPGFFDLAKRLGRNTSDILKCWVQELKKVHSVWSGT
jgi:molybdopterin synthase catalytic subunit